jgi:hypothetical protein
MKGLRNSTWPTASRPSLLACTLAMRHERGLHTSDTVMAAYEEAVVLTDVKHVKTYVPPAPAPVEPVRPLPITSIDNVDDDSERVADDPVEIVYGLSAPKPRVAGEETTEESDEEFEPVEEDEQVSEVADEESEDRGDCAA